MQNLDTNKEHVQTSEVKDEAETTSAFGCLEKMGVIPSPSRPGTTAVSIWPPCLLTLSVPNNWQDKPSLRPLGRHLTKPYRGVYLTQDLVGQ